MAIGDILRVGEQFGRQIVVQLNDLEFRANPDGWSINVRVQLKRGKQPEATIKIYNVPAEVSARVCRAKRRDLRVRVLAGYVDTDWESNPPVVFDGNIVRDGASVSFSGVDRVLTLICKEGAIAFSKPVNVSHSATISTVAEAIAYGVYSTMQGGGNEQGVNAVRSLQTISDRLVAAKLGAPVAAFTAEETAAPVDGTDSLFLGLAEDNIREKAIHSDITQRKLLFEKNGIQGFRSVGDDYDTFVAGQILDNMAKYGPDVERAKKVGAAGVNLDECTKINMPLGFNATGTSWEVLSKLGATVGYEVAVNKGFLEFYARRKPRLLEGPLISAANNTLLSGPNPQGKGKFNITASLQPELCTKDRLQVIDPLGLTSGVFVCDEHTMQMDSGYSDEFTSAIVMRLDP